MISNPDYVFDFHRNICLAPNFLFTQLKCSDLFTHWIEVDESKKRKISLDHQKLPKPKSSKSILTPNPFQFRVNHAQDSVLLDLMIKNYYFGEPKFYIGDTDFRKFYSLRVEEALDFTGAFFLEEQECDTVIEFLEKLKLILKNVSSQESHVNEINSLLNIPTIEILMTNGMSGREMMDIFAGVHSLVFNHLIPSTGVYFPGMLPVALNPIEEHIRTINAILVCA